MLASMKTTEVIILDFETTGMTTDSSRIIEVGAALVSGGEITATFSSLCDPGERIPSFITGLTGITNAMVRGQPSPEAVMKKFRGFIGERPILAHNASFDGRFLKAEMKRVGHTVTNPLLCTMLLARRLLQNAENHKLGTLCRHIGYQMASGHQEHRALDDVKVTVALWNHMLNLVHEATGSVPSFSLLQKLTRTPKHQVREKLGQLSKV